MLDAFKTTLFFSTRYFESNSRVNYALLSSRLKAISEYELAVTTLPGNFFVIDFLSGASGHVIVTAKNRAC